MGQQGNFSNFFPMIMTSLFTVHDVDLYVVGQADVAERDGRPGGSPGVPV